jgi:hypothetical protein
MIMRLFHKKMRARRTISCIKLGGCTKYILIVNNSKPRNFLIRGKEQGSHPRGLEASIMTRNCFAFSGSNIKKSLA